jgi:FMN phosphatase YigB (HAD superfamily)
VAGENDIPAKPDPAPFRICLEALGVPAGAAVYVGDDWRIDICGARQAGLNPVWLKHESIRRNWPDVQTDVPVITRLDQLFGLDLIRG